MPRHEVTFSLETTKLADAGDVGPNSSSQKLHTLNQSVRETSILHQLRYIIAKLKTPQVREFLEFCTQTFLHFSSKRTENTQENPAQNQQTSMPTSAQSYSRSHALLLLQKLLNLRDNASPLTLILDSLEQSAKPVVREFIARAKVSKSKVVFVSFATVKKPPNIDLFIKARGKSAEALSSEIVSHYPTGAPGHSHKVLLVIDSLNPLSSTAPSQLAQFLGSIITPAVSLLGVYHTDVPLVVPSSFSEYEPHPLTVLSHLATAILRVSSLYQVVERRKAQNRSLQEPDWGLKEGREGVLIGLRPKSQAGVGDGLVLEMELRRRSGRSVSEKFVMTPGSDKTTGLDLARIRLLSDHPAFRDPSDATYEGGVEGEEPESTFSLGLTEKQRRDREGVVLPYFDAQTDIGSGEGGRILYEMGREDDFDDEEDEI